MRPFRTFSLKQKITGLILAASCVVLVLSSSFFVASQIITYERLIVGELKAVADIIANNVTAAVVFDDPRSAGETLSALRAKPSVLAARIHTVDGAVFAEYRAKGAAGTADLAPGPERAGAARGRATIESARGHEIRYLAGYVDLRAPIELDGEMIGTVVIRSDLRPLYDIIERYLLVAALAMLVLIVIAFVIAARLQKVVSEPILHLVETMRTVSTERDYSVRATKKGADELGQLTDGFNAMLERIQAHDAELRRAWHEAESASRAKTAFLANMSHELRTPLNAIIGFSEILKGQLLGPLGNERYRHYAEDIFDSGHHLLAVINDILDISKVEAGEFELNEQETDLRDLIDGSVRLVRDGAEAAGLELVVNADPQVPTVVLDQRLIKQSLINLLSNAIKFSPGPGRITVGMANAPDGAVLLSVADTGIGIAKEDIARILQPFAQVESAFSRSHEGTGLGLALAKSFMEAHGGTIEVRSKLDVGTTVTMCFPPERALRAGSSVRAAPAR
ncbi:MAG: ATP-binding protein [Kiloniellaceae bacterium]